MTVPPPLPSLTATDSLSTVIYYNYPTRQRISCYVCKTKARHRGHKTRKPTKSTPRVLQDHYLILSTPPIESLIFQLLSSVQVKPCVLHVPHRRPIHRSSLTAIQLKTRESVEATSETETATHRSTHKQVAILIAKSTQS